MITICFGFGVFCSYCFGVFFWFGCLLCFSLGFSVLFVVFFFGIWSVVWGVCVYVPFCFLHLLHGVFVGVLCVLFFVG